MCLAPTSLSNSLGLLYLHEDTEGPLTLQGEHVFLREVQHPAVSNGAAGLRLVAASSLPESSL